MWFQGVGECGLGASPREFCDQMVIFNLLIENFSPSFAVISRDRLHIKGNSGMTCTGLVLSVNWPLRKIE